MKLRLHGTPAECATAADRLRCTPGLHIMDESRPYPDRTGELVRVYLTAHLDPTSNQADERVDSHRTLEAEYADYAEELRRRGWSQPTDPGQHPQENG